MVGKEPKILLVDDDELSRRMMGLLLSEKGYNYDTASNGIEAVNSVQSRSYDMVLMDLQMPLMDGFDATRKIREWEAEKKHTPIVALTAMLFDNEIQRCLNAGIDECIAKPFDSKTLFQLIDSFVNKPGQPASTKELQDVGGEDGPWQLYSEPDDYQVDLNNFNGPFILATFRNLPIVHIISKAFRAV